MSEQPSEIKKLMAIASDPELSPELRSKAVELIGNIGSRDAFLALLELAANEKLLVDERDLALKRAREIVKSSR